VIVAELCLIASLSFLLSTRTPADSLEVKEFLAFKRWDTQGMTKGISILTNNVHQEISGLFLPQPIKLDIVKMLCMKPPNAPVLSIWTHNIPSSCVDVKISSSMAVNAAAHKMTANHLYSAVQLAAS